MDQWSTEKLQEMERWRKSNSAKGPETAAHFLVDYKKYVSARAYHLGKKGSAVKNKKVSGRKYAFVDIPVPTPTVDTQIVVIKCNAGALAQVLRSL